MTALGVVIFFTSTVVLGVTRRQVTQNSAAKLFEVDFKFLCEDNPEYASQAGQHAFDGKLQDLSPAAFDNRVEYNEQAIIKATKILQGLSNTDAHHRDRLHLSLFIKNINDELKGLELDCHLTPVNSIGYGGVHNNFIEALDWLEDENEQVNFLSRLAAFPRQCDQYKALLRLGIQKRCVASAAMVRKVPTQLNDLMVSLDINKGPICDLLDQLSTEQAAEGVEKKTLFRNAVADLLSFFTTEYIPHARETPGCLGMVNGKGAETYAHCLKYHTTTSMSADEIHTIGIEEVTRIMHRYQVDVMDRMGWKGSFTAFVKKWQSPTSGQYYEAQDKKGILADYTVLCAKIEEKLSMYFEKLPVSKMEIVELNSPTSPAAFYMQGTVDMKRPGKFYVNVCNLGERPKYNMYALALHEAVPGHHLQGSLAIENAAIPPFIRFIEDRRYEYCPARRNIYAAYLEGWALYCEALGEEMDFYPSPLELFGRLSMEMMRAVRLVVDTGIHSKGWSIEQAITYMMTNTGMHRNECEAECYRYEAWPGQACAYKVGEVAIWRMRKRAEACLGPAFDIKKFHSCVLENGPLPLDTLGDLVDEWIASQQ